MQTFIIFINSFAFIFYLYFTIQYVNYFRFKFLILFPVYFSQLWLICSSYYYDLGNVYSFELEITSTTSISTTFLIVSNLLFFIIVKFKLNKLNFFKENEFDILKYSEKKNNSLFDFILIIILVFNVGILLYMLNNGIPLLSGIDRAQYATNILNTPIFNIFYKNYLVMCFFLGILISRSIKKGYRKPIIISQVLFVLILTLLEGNKFSRFLDIVSILCIAPVFLGVFERIKSKILIRLSTLIVISLILIFYMQSKIFESILSVGSGSLFGYIFDRILVLQGAIWWKSFNIVVSHGSYNFTHLQNEIKNIFESINGYTGLKYLMEITAGGNYVNKILVGESKFLLSGASPAIYLVSFGPFFYWLVIMSIAYIYSYLIYFLKILIVKENLLILFFFITFFQTFQNFYVSGNFEAFFILGNLFRFTLMFIALFLSQILHKRIEIGKDL